MKYSGFRVTIRISWGFAEASLSPGSGGEGWRFDCDPVFAVDLPMVGDQAGADEEALWGRFRRIQVTVDRLARWKG